MDFDFSEEQYSFRESIRGFLANRKGLGPGSVRPSGGDAASSGGDAETLWSSLADLGTFAALVPEEYGGLGLTFVDLTLVLEEFGRGLVPPLVIETLVATDLIARYGSEEQKSTMLPRVADGRLKLSNALCEANAGYDPLEMSVSVGRGERIGPVEHLGQLNGAKILVPAAKAADYLLVAARCDDSLGSALVLVERERPGIELREHRTLDLMSAYHEVTFADVQIAGRDYLGGAPSGEAVRRLVDASAACAATFMTGIAGQVMDTTVEYVKQRNQFGKPIGSFQAIKHKCADMAVSVDSCRSAAYYAAWTVAGNMPDRPKAVSIAKSFCGDMARFVCNEGIQLHGGMGFTWDLGLHHYLRRAKLLEYSYGDASYHRRRVIAEALRGLHAI
jgi:alkylation response protein AidB-like acyl-CoA dehydrogenase